MARRQSKLLSDEQLEEMAALREKGWGVQRIADHFRDRDGVTISPGAINWQCLKVGADVPKRLRGTLPINLKPYTRRGFVVRPYSAEDDALLRELDGQGKSVTEIATRLGRKVNSIKGRMLTIGRHDARAEESEAA